MTTEYRVDLGTLRPPRRTRDGMLRVDAHITRVGVFEYRNLDGTIRREYRPREEVFHPETLASFEQIPVTDGHPPEEVSPRNAKRYMVGASGERVVVDDDHVRTSLLVADADTISAMEAKRKVEVSCGYRCDLDWTPGVAPDGTRYDAIQRNIRGNHIAIVEVGRAGPTARVRMDAMGVPVYDQNLPEPRKESGMPPTKKPDSSEDTKKLLEVAAQKLAAAEQRADAAEASLADAESRADKAEARATSLEERVAKLESTRIDSADLERRDADIASLRSKLAAAEKARQDAESPERLRAAVKRRVRIENAAAVVFGPEYVTDSMDDRDLMIAIVERARGTTVDTSRSDDYIESRFDTAVEDFMRGADALQAMRDAHRGRQDEQLPRVDAKSARQKMIERNQQAGLQPLTKGA